ncbi:TPA: hypothetical protein QCX73_005705 [Bacillus mycoides]|nr:hypothetical protein [Bacillus mycoides]HDR7630979.1 hypothetical protein [Bacillus mycoides]
MMENILFFLVKGMLLGIGQQIGGSLSDSFKIKEKTTQTTAIVKERFRKMFK